MPQRIQATRNLYRGINAHLHSHYQAHGGWHAFHAAHINDLMRGLLPDLLPMGYSASLETSLQIRREGQSDKHPRADVAIFDRQPQHPPVTAAQTPNVATFVAPLPDVLPLPPDLAPYRAVVVYALDAPQGLQGQAVAWIELLSPANKPGGSHARTYSDKRYDLLQSGLVFVEIDYLHESLPTLATLPAYRTRANAPGHPAAHPYHIAVLDPRPHYNEGQVKLYAFDVDAAIPAIPIPLNAGDVLTADLGSAYNKTYSELLLGLQHVDYSQLPAQFDRYSLADQRRSLNRMIAIIEAAQRADNLEHTPIEPANLPLEEAMRRYQVLVA